MKRILVCGGRDFKCREQLFQMLDTLAGVSDEEPLGEPVVIIHGAARGADSLADEWAVINWQTIEEYKAEWDKYGKRAGYIRNKRMLDEGKPDLVVAFPGGKGTAMMVDIATKAGVKVIKVE
jgi:hypothetical protein